MGKVIWITGAGSGIGKALALAYNENGNTIILSGRKKEQLEEVAALLSNSYVLPMDVADELAIAKAVSKVETKFDKVDILINNAGVSQRALVTETSNEVGRKLMEVNFFGSVHLTKAVLPLIQKGSTGNIVGMSSIVGKFGFPLRSYYAASKHALHGFYEALGLELKDTNINTTVVCPGRIKTDISKNALKGDGAAHAQIDPGQQNGVDVNVCARKIKRGIARNKSEIYVGGGEILFIYIKRYFPALFRFIAKRINPN
ncbi:SDR family oxidoreductase [Bacteroidia bacterium]|nr:SDR family oxidoreductase [Bacteroidia bacterium]MDB9881914.1 SDR family oxidoreductase [Bacteroidia bacterium]MDC1394895.1 SDR family oxidoreductase [Bacteroidia bacterium]